MRRIEAKVAYWLRFIFRLFITNGLEENGVKNADKMNFIINVNKKKNRFFNSSLAKHFDETNCGAGNVL